MPKMPITYTIKKSFSPSLKRPFWAFLANLQTSQKMAKMGQNVKGLTFAFWPTLTIYIHFSTLVNTTKNEQYRTGDNDCLMRE